MAKKDAMEVAPDGSLVKFEDLIKLVAGKDNIEVEMIIVGSNAGYWAPEAGAGIHGILVNRFEVDTQYGMVGLYTVQVGDRIPCTYSTKDGELFTAKPGDLVSVLERAMLKQLAGHIGKEVVIQCLGKSETTDGNTLWNYQGSVVKNRTAGGIQSRL